MVRLIRFGREPQGVVLIGKQHAELLMVWIVQVSQATDCSLGCGFLRGLNQLRDRYVVNCIDSSLGLYQSVVGMVVLYRDLIWVPKQCARQLVELTRAVVDFEVKLL